MSRQPYSIAEKRNIVQYIIDHHSYNVLRGTKVWQDMETRRVCGDRTWQSMKEHFRRCIFDNLHCLQFEQIEIDRIRDGYQLTSKTVKKRPEHKRYNTVSVTVSPCRNQRVFNFSSDEEEELALRPKRSSPNKSTQEITDESIRSKETAIGNPNPGPSTSRQNFKKFKKSITPSQIQTVTVDNSTMVSLIPDGIKLNIKNKPFIFIQKTLDSDDYNNTRIHDISKRYNIPASHIDCVDLEIVDRFKKVIDHLKVTAEKRLNDIEESPITTDDETPDLIAPAEYEEDGENLKKKSSHEIYVKTVDDINNSQESNETYETACVDLSQEDSSSSENLICTAAKPNLRMLNSQSLSQNNQSEPDLNSYPDYVSVSSESTAEIHLSPSIFSDSETDHFVEIKCIKPPGFKTHERSARLSKTADHLVRTEDESASVTNSTNMIDFNEETDESHTIDLSFNVDML